MWQEYGLTQEVLKAIYFLLFIAILGAFLLSYTKAVELNQERYEKALAQYTEELSKEVALFEQKLSLERRAWSRIIHGEVQSALTAAATRLQREEHLENYHLELVKQDLNRAKENLTNPTKPKTNFSHTINDIIRTWQQICQINLNISARAARALDQSEDTREATIEIIKEAISNAIRHGDAKEINIKLNRHQDDILEIEIENNGRKLNPEAKKGLGSQMIDELTLSWHMDNKTKPTLKAQIPISKNQ
jgi:signal transduction histidine kinase